MHSAVRTLWRSVGPQFGGRWHKIIWEALHSATMWACFSRPSTLASCGVQSAKTHFWCDVRAQKQQLSDTDRHTISGHGGNVLTQWKRASCGLSDSSSHGRTSIRNVISRPAPCFLLEYTVFPVCCYHLPLCAKETQGSEDLSSGRAEVICFPKRHFRVFASFGGPS